MRLLRLTIACIIFGFITTVAVAWGLAAWLPQRNWPQQDLYRTNPVGMIHVAEYESAEATRRTISTIPLDGKPHLPFVCAIDQAPGINSVMSSSRMIPDDRWGFIPGQYGADSYASNRCEHATGWPLVAGWYGVTTLNAAYVIDGGVQLHSSRTGTLPTLNASKVRALPLRPIWTGLATNTAFYAIVWLGFAYGVSSVLRVKRRRHGMCVRCAYDLRGLRGEQPCPECGLPPPPAVYPRA